MDFVIWLWVFATWIFVAVSASDIGGSKGYSAAGWFVLGVLFGVFALLVVGFREPKRKAPAKAAAAWPGEDGSPPA